MGAKRDRTREELVQLLTELGTELNSRGIRGELFIVDGAAMSLAFDSRRLSTDVDGVFAPRTVIADAARVVASRHPKLDDDWINDAMKGFLPGPDTAQQVILDVPGVRILVPSPEYLLATKIRASRSDRDEDAITFLANIIGLRTSYAVLDLVDRFYPRTQLPPEIQFFIQQTFA